MSDTSPAPTAGELLRSWRQRRRLTQLELSAQAEVSTKHLSFLETGRAASSRQMLVHLAEHLDIPLRERNVLLIAAGFAPLYSETDLQAPEMAAVHTAIQRLLASHEPYPAVVVDRWWNLVSGNTSIALLVEDIDEELLTPPVNVLRASLHPRGLAPRIRNLSEWRTHLLTRLRGQVDKTGDPDLATLLRELDSYGGSESVLTPTFRYDGVVVPLRLRSSRGPLNLLSTVATFGTPNDVTVAELSLESFFPADDETRARLQQTTADNGQSSPLPGC